MFKRIRNTVLIALAVCVTLVGCSDTREIEAELNQAKLVANSSAKTFNKLKSHTHTLHHQGVNEKKMRSAIKIVKAEFPDNNAVNTMVKQFLSDTTPSSVFYIQAKNAYAKLKQAEIPNLSNVKVQDVTSEMRKQFVKSYTLNMDYIKAYNVTVFDNQFIDYVNTMARLSKKVTPINVPTISNESAVGSSMVGNPNYGKWVEKSDGSKEWSFLETYAFLSILNNTMSPMNSGYRPYRYDNWRSTRSYSYYNDNYVKTSAPVNVRRSYAKQTSSYSKQYKSSIKPNKSVNSYLAANKSVPKTVSTKSSSYSRPTSSYSKSSTGSVRNSSTSRSVSSSRGK